MPSAIPRETSFSRAVPSHEEFIARLDSIEKIVNSDNLLLNEDLGATEKGGFHWIVRVIMSPLSYLFCRDPFSDVRMNRVAQKLEEYLRINQQHFASKNSSKEVKAISDRIIAQLNKRTHNRYHAVLDRVLKKPHDRLAGLERADADAGQRAAWTTELNGLRDTVARNQNQQAALQANVNKLGEGLKGLRQKVGRNRNPQNGTMQELRNQQAGLREGFNELREKFGELSRAVKGNQNPQNGELHGLRELREEFNELRGELRDLSQAVARNQNPQNGELQGLRELQEGFNGLKREFERLGQAVDRNQNSQNGGLQELREQLARLETKFSRLKEEEVDKLGELVAQKLHEQNERLDAFEHRQNTLNSQLEELRVELRRLGEELNKFRREPAAGNQNPQNERLDEFQRRLVELEDIQFPSLVAELARLNGMGNSSLMGSDLLGSARLDGSTTFHNHVAGCVDTGTDALAPIVARLGGGEAPPPPLRINPPAAHVPPN